MTKSILIILCFVLVSCSKQPGDDAIKNTDSIAGITPPEAPATASNSSDDSSGLVIDRARLRTAEHQKLLERFSPADVVKIYHDYRPLRQSAGMNRGRTDVFLRSHHLSLVELEAILAEGDMLGWNKHPN